MLYRKKHVLTFYINIDIISVNVHDKVVSRFDVGKSWIQSVGKLVGCNQS